ncbi:MAG TPA: hypothetical protein VKR06_37095 [Ktedonosporobacter sp.]|nr:hypothetical protein [Ktedonosporobacter sp.]
MHKGRVRTNHVLALLHYGIAFVGLLFLVGCGQDASQPGQSQASDPVDWKSLYTITIVASSEEPPVSPCVNLQGGPIAWSATVDGHATSWPLLYGDGPEFPLSKADIGKCIRFSGKQYRLQQLTVGHCTDQQTSGFVFCFKHPPREGASS